MISSIASMASSSSATVRVEKATSEFLIGPDWTLNIDICDTINSNQMLAKDVVKAVKKRLQHKNPKVQLLALTLLETVVKNCGDYVHFQIAERNILQEMVKIVRKKTDIHVRDKILTLIGSWHEAFGGRGGRYPQYYIAYEDLRRSGVDFPQRPPDAAPIFTPPITTHQISRQPGFGMPSTSSTRLDQVMAADGSLSLSSLNSMRDVLDLLTDMLQAADPSDRSSLEDEVIVDLVEQCRANQRKLMHFLGTTGDEELLSQGLELNDGLQNALARHDSIASGSAPAPIPKVTPREPDKHHEYNSKSNTSNNATSSNTPPAPALQENRGLVDEEDEEDDDFAQLARRHSKTRANTSMAKGDAHSEASSSLAMSNALVPINAPLSSQIKDQDIIDLLSITLSTEQTPSTQKQSPENIPSSYPGNTGLPYNNYVAPWALAQPKIQYQPLQVAQPRHPSPGQFQPFPSQLPVYPPPPWAATPGYFSNQRPYIYSNPGPSQYESTYRERPQVNNSGQGSMASNVGPKPFIPSYRLFEDLNVFGNADGRFEGNSNASSSLSDSNNRK